MGENRQIDPGPNETTETQTTSESEAKILSERREYAEYLKLDIIESTDKLFGIKYDKKNNHRSVFCLGRNGFHLRQTYFEENATVKNIDLNIDQKQDVQIDQMASIRRGFVTGVEVKKHDFLYDTEKEPTFDIVVLTVVKPYVIFGLKFETANDIKKLIWQWIIN
jgi:hypothetical protein